MKFYLISDNVDTYMGMRLAGIEGVVVNDSKDVMETVKTMSKQGDIGILLITQKLVQMCPDFIHDTKLSQKRPLLVEIPDRNSDSRVGSLLEQYIGEAIGIKM